MDRIGLGFLHLNPGEINDTKTFKQRQNDIFHQNVFENIRKENSKLRTYSLLKTEIGKEKYLDRVQNVQNRVLLTKIRLSNHTLMIEKGRHLKIEKTAIL